MPRCRPEAGPQEKASVGVPRSQSRRERFYGPRSLRGRAWVAKPGQRRGTQDPFPKGFPGSNPGPRIIHSPRIVPEVRHTYETESLVPGTESSFDWTQVSLLSASAGGQRTG